jgi:hypothetical protein
MQPSIARTMTSTLRAMGVQRRWREVIGEMVVKFAS